MVTLILILTSWQVGFSYIAHRAIWLPADSGANGDSSHLLYHLSQTQIPPSPVYMLMALYNVIMLVIL